MRRILAFLLALVLLAGSVPAGAVHAHATEVTGPEELILPEETTPEEPETVPEETVPEETVPEETVPEAAEVTLPALQTSAVPDGLTYSVGTDSVTITGYTGTNPDLVIPATIEGKPVTAVRSSAFDNNSVITSLTLPEGMTTLGSRAFAYCANLETVRIPKSLTTMGGSVFIACFRLTNVYVEDLTSWLNITYTDSTASGGPLGQSSSGENKLYVGGELLTALELPAGITRIPAGAFHGCSHIQGQVAIPQGVVTIDDNAFRNTGITGVTFPEGLTLVDEYAFFGCKNLTALRLPEGLERIGTGAFKGCSDLASAYLPDSITRLGLSSFEGCTSLKQIRLPAGIDDIPHLCFYNSGLNVVQIPAGVAEICYGAFDGVALQHVFFAGTEEQWNAIAVDQGNDSLTNATVHCGVQGGELTPIFAPNCQGYALFFCGICQKYFYDESYTGAKGDHIYENGICTACGDVNMPQLADLTYQVEADGTVTLTAFTGTGPVVRIPAVVGGKPVAAIGENAFAGCALWHILFAGTEAQWNAITVASGNEALETAAVHFAADGTEITPTDIVNCQGKALYHCAVCDKYLYDETYTGEKGDHTYENGTCTRCGEKDEPLPADLAYQIAEDGTVTLTAFTGTGPVALIPATIEGKTVTTIGENAFANADLWHVLFTGTPQAWYAITIEPGNDILDQIPVHQEAMGNEVIPGKQTTCTELPLWECTICGDMLLDETYEGSHNYEDKICTVCGDHKDFTYLVENGTVTITGYRGKDTQVTVPDTIAGLPVTAIGDGAFYDGFAITKITLPESITDIGASAFAYCYKLTSVNLPDGVTTIGSAAFTCCEQLRQIHIPAGVTRLGMDAFFNCTSLKIVTLPEGLTYIGDYAFGYCQALPELKIPSTVTYMGDYAFRGCSALTEVTLPAGLTVINEGLLSCCPNLERIVIPEGVKEVGIEAFFQNYRMSSVTLPLSVTVVGKQAFSQCDNLRCVAYAGSREQMAQITVDSGNSIFKNANWHFNGTYCTVSLDKITTHHTGKPYLLWDDLACMQGYKIYRATSSKGTFEYLGTTRKPYFVDESAKFGKQYYYKLTGINSLGAETAKTGAKSAYCRCAQPEITAESPNGIPVIFWEKVENATKYEVWRSETSHDTFKKIATTSSLSYTDSKAPKGKVSYYKVRALGSSSNVTGNYSNIEGTGYAVAKPAVKLTLTSAGMPSLTWSKITGATFYDIYRSTDGDVYEKIGCQTNTTFTDQNAPADTECFYYVVAVAPGEGCSGTGDVLTIATACPTPTASANSHSESGLPVISWKAVEGAAEYEISRATKSSGTYTVVGTTGDLSFTDTTATAGKTFYYKVTAITPKGTRSKPSSYCSCKCVLAAPVIAVDGDATTGKPVITWNAVTGAKKYEVYRATSEKGSYSKLTTTTKLTYTNTSASTGKTYFYKVKAVASSTSYNSPYSQVVNCLCVCARPKVTLKLTAATGQPELSWSKITGASRYEIRRSTAEEGEYTTLTTQTGTTFQDTGAVADAVYYYKVIALASNSLYNSREAAAASITATCGQAVITTASDGVTGLPVISWKAVAGASAYQIARSTKSSGTYTVVGTTADLTFTDATAPAGKTSYYKVTALTPKGNAAVASSYKSAKCILAAPVIAAAADTATGKPVITWEAVTGAKKYEVYRATSETGKYTKLTTTTKLSYTNTSASAGKTYFYKVKAVASSSSYNSAYSQVTSCLCICAQPKVSVKLNSSTGQPLVTWGKVTGAVGYEIRRSIGEGETVSLGEQTAVTYQDTTAPAASVCSYQVRAIAADDACSSIFSAVVSVNVACPTPVILTAAADGETGYPRMSWAPVEGADHYVITRATSAKGKYTQIGTTTEDFYLDDSAQMGKTYYYKVAAVTAAGVSSPASGYKAIKRTVPAPVITSITLNSSGNPTIEWTEIPGAQHYEVYRSTQKDSGYEKIKNSTWNVTFNIVPNPYVVYYYKVRAVMGSNVYSPFSQPVATTSVTLKNTLSMELNSIAVLRAEYMGMLDLHWSSSDETVVVVKDGRLYSRNTAGTAVITVTDGNCSASCTVTVKEPKRKPLQILTPKDTIMYPGETLQLEYYYEGDGELTWSCDFPEIFTVSDTGLVTAVGEGSTYVIVTDGTNRASLRIQVKNPVEKTTEMTVHADHFLFEENVKMVGDYLHLKVRTEPDPQMKDITFTTTDQGIVSVEWDTSQQYSADDIHTWLILRFNHPGTATVTITSDDRQISRSYTFHVKEEFACYPGKEKLTPEEFAYYVTEVGVEMGHSRSKVLSGYQYMWVAEEDLTWECARVNGISEAHRNYKFFDNDYGYRPLLCTYAGWDEEMEKHLFYTGY